MKNNSASKLSSFAKRSLSLLACGAVIVTAYAATTFNSATGFGFVEKEDVQLAFGWNNAALQSNAADVSFTYVRAASYTIECTWDTETGGKNSKVIDHSVTHIISGDVSSAVTTATRNNPQGKVTGFNLCGFTNATSSGAVPSVGDTASCPGEQGTGAVGTVVSVNPTGTSGGLYVNHGSSSVLLLQ